MRSITRTYSYNRLFLCVATLALGILGHSTAQAQIGGVPLWTNRYRGSAYVVAVDGSGNVFVAGSSSDYDYATIKYSSAGTALWTNRYSGPGNGVDEAHALAADAGGSVFVTGSSIGTNGFYDYATIKYSGAGVPLWTNRYSGPGNAQNYASAIAVDGSGNVFVTGFPTGSGGDSDYATIKYSSAGTAMWTNRYNGPGNGADRANALAVDGSGNVIVTGASYGDINLTTSDYATIKYSNTGVPLWTNRYGPYAIARSVAVDGSGNVFVTGSSLYDYATIKYSGEGVPLWTNYYDKGSANVVAVDGSGDVFVTGDSGTNGTDNYTTLKYSGAGVPLWTNRYNGLGGITVNQAFAMAVDGGGNVFVTGNSGGNGFYDYATIAYSGAGVPLWTNRYNGPWGGDDQANAIVVDGGGNVFVTGSSWNGSDYDYATIKYSSAVPPSLTITRTTTNTVAISWPSPSPGFTLQQNTNGLSTVNWSNVVVTPSDDATTRTVIVDPPIGNRFYRLVHP